MSYPQDLDELETTVLVAELERRRKCDNDGLCTYCSRPVTAAPCKFPGRHLRMRVVARHPPEVSDAPAR